MSGAAYQVAIRAMQTIKELQASPLKSLKVRKFSGGIDSTGFKTDQLKQAEESLRTVMYLSCWGPN